MKRNNIFQNKKLFIGCYLRRNVVNYLSRGKIFIIEDRK